MEEISLLEKENKELKEENESLRNDIAVNDMLHESFKERMREKYLYNTEDEDIEYDADEGIREKNRELFRKRKSEIRRKVNVCEICGFIGKNETGLKTHTRMKH